MSQHGHGRPGVDVLVDVEQEASAKPGHGGEQDRRGASQTFLQSVDDCYLYNFYGCPVDGRKPV